MAHTYPNILIHAIFSTKERKDLIPDELQPRLWKYFAGIGKKHGIPVLAAGGVANHAHLLFVLPADLTTAKALQLFKEQLTLDRRARNRLLLAAGIQRAERERLSSRCGTGVHRTPASAPPETVI